MTMLDFEVMFLIFVMATMYHKLLIIRPHHTCVASRCDLLQAMFMVCELVTTMYCGKTAGPIEMPFGMHGGVGDSHHVLDGGPLPREWAILGWGSAVP